MYCTNCGSRIDKGKFCANCGMQKSNETTDKHTIGKGDPCFKVESHRSLSIIMGIKVLILLAVIFSGVSIVTLGK